MKKYLSLFLALVMLFCLMGTAFAEGNTPTFVFSEETAAPGEEVRVTINVQNNPGFCSAKLVIHYDEAALEWTDVIQGEYTTGLWKAWIDKGFFTWVGGHNDNHDGLYATLVFQVKDDAAAGDYEITATYDEDDVFNDNYDNIAFDVQAGKVTVTESETPLTAPTFVFSEETAAPGEEVRVTINVQNNPGFCSAKLVIHYDETALEWTEVIQGEYTTGLWKAWIDKGFFTWVGGHNDNHDGLYATLVFKVKDDAAAGDYEVTATYDEDDVFNDDYDNIAFDVKAGKVTVTAAQEEPAFKTHSLVLSGSIGVNFFMYLPTIQGVDWNDSYMTFEISGKGDVSPERDDFDENDKDVNTGNYFGFTAFVTSIQMADKITATFHWFENGEEKTLENTYSINEYVLAFNQAVEDGTITADDTTLQLVRALADFGHYVQIFLDAERDWERGTDYAEMDTCYHTDDYDIAQVTTAVADSGITCSSNAGDVFSKVTFTLVLDSETAIRFYLTPKDGGTVSSDDVTCTGDKTPTVTKSGSRYIVEIPNISAHQLSTTYTLTIGGSVTFNVSALSYVKLMLTKYAGNTDALNAAAAIYWYSEAANAYKAAHSGN